jgi:CheY-like chemotaxis protein
MEADSPLTILLVDDDDDVTGLFSRFLKHAGYHVSVASNGRDALELFQQAAGKVDLLVTDVEMPFMSGTELAKIVAGGGCPVLLISGRAAPPETASEGWDFLAKPFTPADFVATVKQVLSRKDDSSQSGSAIRLRVALAEDDAEVRSRLCKLLNPDCEVVAALADCEAMVENAEGLRPDLIMLDIGMPGMNGFAAARILRRLLPDVPVIFVTQHAEPAYVREAFELGVAGYVIKRNAGGELSTAIQQVRSGDRYLSPLLKGV